MKREEALALVKQNIFSRNLIKHCLAVEAVMRVLARHFDKDEEKWALTGLLHDIDCEMTKRDPDMHSYVAVDMLEDLGIDKDIISAVKIHNYQHGIEPQTLLEKALFVTDPITGLIVAAALVLPSKKLSDLKVDSVLKRYREGAFAKGANREVIAKCEDYLGLRLEGFAKIALEAMQGISDNLDL
jgi:uncharacterized protein